MENKNQLIALGVVALLLVGAIVFIMMRGRSGGAAKTGEDTKTTAKKSPGRRGRRGAAAEEETEESGAGGAGEKVELQEPEPFVEYEPFQIKPEYGFRDPMKPLIELEATPTPIIDHTDVADKEKLPGWAEGLKGIVWDTVNPSQSVAVWVDPNDPDRTVSGSEGEAILPLGMDPKEEVIVKTIWPSGVMLLYEGVEFNKLLPEDTGEDIGMTSGGKGKGRGRSGRSSRRSRGRGGRR